ncbi:MAG: hypothetical protein ACRDJ9_30455 [Dehalococcoidia bacterium]
MSTRPQPPVCVATPEYVLSDPLDREIVAKAIGQGMTVAHGFANFYVISTRPVVATVRRVNLMKGRPAGQVGSVTTTRAQMAGLFDWSRLPDGLTRAAVEALMDDLFARGPFGFRGPAAAHMPEHLTLPDSGVRTTQLIAPGYDCPSNTFLARTLAELGGDYLYITSANRSRHLTVAEDEPAHWQADGIEAEFGREPGFLVLRHDDEDAARRRYPCYAPMSTTILAFHKLGGVDEAGRPRLIVERHGSLPAEDVRRVVERHGFGLTLGPKAARRLALREYANAIDEGVAA